MTDGKTLKLLAITSSFGLNTTEHLYEIAKAEGYTDVVVARLYTSGCTLMTHVSNADNDAPAYEYTKKADGVWTRQTGKTIAAGLSDEDWNVIFIQQSAAQAPIAESYGSYIASLKDYVLQQKPDARFVWNMTWAFDEGCTQSVFANTFGGDQLAMYQAIVDATKSKVLNAHKDIARIIPTGTAIQNARAAGSGFLTRETNTLGVDRYHLNQWGRIIAGYTLFASITGQEITQADIIDTVNPAYHYPNESAITLTAEQKDMIVTAVNAALEQPYAITN